MAWHKRIDETMLHLHVAEAHTRQPPKHVQQAARRIADRDARVLAMLGARSVESSNTTPVIASSTAHAFSAAGARDSRGARWMRDPISI